MLKNQILLITGGTGSFGNAVVNRFLKSDVNEIRIFSRDEKKQEDMRLALNNSKLKFYIGDVRNYDSIYEAMNGVDYVFHAAALKQVPSCEFYPLEAIKTNILGAENVMNSALARKVKSVVMLSTDKAVYPINAMGISKAMMEKLVVAKARRQSDGGTKFCATRYGNVMASRGSVIPLFISQILAGKNLTVTDPNMTRFLMSLEESVDLVLYAFMNGKQGDIFVQKAPASTVKDLTQALQELFQVDLPVNIIGTRHGEKLFETLVSREEIGKAIDHGKYYQIPADNRDLNYSEYFLKGDVDLSNLQDYTSHNAERLDTSGVKNILLKLDFIKDALRDIKAFK
jgi:UDP-glucose 4-epimerase